MGKLDVYIYYQVAEADAPALAARVRAMQAVLACGQLKRRPETAAGRQTWMEIYLGVDAAFGPRLDAAVLAAQLSALTAGERHRETFTDFEQTEAAPCA